MEVPFASEKEGPPFVCLHSLSHIRCAPIRACVSPPTHANPQVFLNGFIYYSDPPTHLPHIHTKRAKNKLTEIFLNPPPPPVCPCTTKNPPPQCSFVPQARYLVVHEDEGTRFRFFLSSFFQRPSRGRSKAEGGGEKEKRKNKNKYEKKLANFLDNPFSAYVFF